MKPENLYTFSSWVITSAIVSAALFSTPYMKRIASGEAIESLAATTAIILAVAVSAGTPWFKLIFSKHESPQKFRKYVFSTAAIGISAFFYKEISTAPAEGIGYNIIFCIALIMLAYPITAGFSTDEHL